MLNLTTPPITDAPPLESVWQFPHPPRHEQKLAMTHLDTAMKTERHLSVEAPVGTGKSPVAVTVARALRGTILVPQNALQRQYLRDWPDMPHLRGGTHYNCVNGTKAHPSCRRGSCSTRKDCREMCPYARAKDEYTAATAALTSYAMFMAMLIHTPDEATGRPWMVCDEAHNLDEAIISASEVSFTETEFMKHTKAGGFPPAPGHNYDLEYASDVLSLIWDGLKRSIAAQPHETPEKLNWENLADAIEIAIGEISRGKDWVCSVDSPHGGGPRKFWVKPLLPDTSFHAYLSRYRILGLSATPIPSAISRQLYRADFKEFAVPSPFPIENRVIHYRPVARMSFRHLAESTPKMASAICKLLTQFPEKGIIHCNSFKLGGDLHSRLDPQAKRRVMLHRPGADKEALLNEFARAPEGAVLMSPSITEGVDLKDDQARFNIIAKVPYPALGDPWVIRRKDQVSGWYDWKTALAMAQATGRTTRHENDWSETIILDKSFEMLYNGSPHYFPLWFQEALKG